MSFALFGDDFHFEFQWGALIPATLLTLIAIGQLGAIDGFLGAGLLLLSLIAHECGHILMAILLRIPIKAVGLCWAGAFTRRQASGNHRTELLIALAGPIISLSLMIASVSWGDIGLWLAKMNCFIAITNLLPFGNSDGQRVFRAIKGLVRREAPPTGVTAFSAQPPDQVTSG